MYLLGVSLQNISRGLVPRVEGNGTLQTEPLLPSSWLCVGREVPWLPLLPRHVTHIFTHLPHRRDPSICV